MECYIEFLNCKNNFRSDRKEFKTYEDAVSWGKENIERFRLDSVKFFKYF